MSTCSWTLGMVSRPEPLPLEPPRMRGRAVREFLVFLGIVMTCWEWNSCCSFKKLKLSVNKAVTWTVYWWKKWFQVRYPQAQLETALPSKVCSKFLMLRKYLLKAGEGKRGLLASDKTEEVVGILPIYTGEKDTFILLFPSCLISHWIPCYTT